MSQTWMIKANERSYGPYTAAQMRSFASEGRLAPHSFVARDGDTQFRTASEDADLAALFRPSAPTRPAFFTADGDGGQQTFGKNDGSTGVLSHYVIIADMKSRSIAGLEEEIHRCGLAFAIMPQAWLLSSELSINALRNSLVQKLGRTDMLFIVDAGRNKAAWFNYGPEADSRVRRVWQKAQEQRNPESVTS
jgi:GYF domain 2